MGPRPASASGLPPSLSLSLLCSCLDSPPEGKNGSTFWRGDWREGEGDRERERERKWPSSVAPGWQFNRKNVGLNFGLNFSSKIHLSFGLRFPTLFISVGNLNSKPKVKPTFLLLNCHPDSHSLARFFSGPNAKRSFGQVSVKSLLSVPPSFPVGDCGINLILLTDLGVVTT